MEMSEELRASEKPVTVFAVARTLHGQWSVRWSAGYVPNDDDEPKVAGVEAPNAIEAVSRLREVVGTDTDVLYVLPDPIIPKAVDGATYDAFLHDPDAATSE